jgi:hypothetical protein
VLPAQKTAVLVVRAWLEEGLEADALRARITRTLDVSEGEPLEAAAASEEEILAVVRAWLRSFAVTAG